MNKTKKLIILALVLVLLVGGYAYISLRPKKTASKTPSKSVQLLKLDKTSITKMILKSNNSTLEIEKSGDSWDIPSLKGDKLKTDVIGDIAATFSSLTASQVVSDNLDNASNYGLNPAVIEATAVLKDGSEKTVYLGNAVPGSSGYYGTLKGDSKVYVLPNDVGIQFSYKAADLRDKTLTTLVVDNETYVKITDKNGKAVELHKVAKGTSETNEFGANGWVIGKPYKNEYSIDTNNAGNLFSAFTSIAISDFVEDNAKDLAKYGLDKPSLDVTGKDDKNTVHLIFGNDKDDSSVYFKTADSNNVYTMDKSIVDNFNVNTFNMISKFVALENIDDVDSILIEGQGLKHEMSMTRKTEKKNGKDETTTTYKLDDKDMAEDSFKTLYQSVIGLLYDSESDKPVQDKAELKITYVRNKDPKNLVFTFSSYDSNFYEVFKNGTGELLISKEKVNSMLQDVQKAASK